MENIICVFFVLVGRGGTHVLSTFDENTRSSRGQHIILSCLLCLTGLADLAGRKPGLTWLTFWAAPWLPQLLAVSVCPGFSWLLIKCH